MFPHADGVMWGVFLRCSHASNKAMQVDPTNPHSAEHGTVHQGA